MFEQIKKELNCVKTKAIAGASILGLLFLGYKIYKKVSLNKKRIWFKNKVILITGASSGIGKTYAETFAKLGSNLVLAARSVDKLEELAEELRTKYSIDVITVKTDVSDENSVKDLAAKALEHFNHIDILINNAGIGSYGYFHDGDITDMRKMMEVNYWGMIYCTKAILPSMIKNGHGKIINISSLVGKIAMPTMSVYSSTKFAMNGFSNALRAEVKRFGVDVLVVCPTGTKTEFVNNSFDKGKFKLSNTANFWMSPNRVANETIDAILDNKREHILGFAENVSSKFNDIAPTIVDKVLALAPKFMVKE
ncbi:MAG: SDR family oxidoreductase [Candidatus Sericytochromatia bacterium]